MNLPPMNALPRMSTFKFGLLCGALTALATVLSSLTFGISRWGRHGEVMILFSGVVFAAPVCLGPYFAGRKGWLSFSVSPKLSALAALPLLFLPVAFFVGMIGWGDMQEHLIRASLHATHRELTDKFAAALILVGIVAFGATAVSSLVWISASVLTKRWRARTLLILWTGCVTLSGLFWMSAFAPRHEEVVVATVGLILVFISGFLFALAVEMNTAPSRISLIFRFASGIVLVAVVGGGSILVANSVPERRFPTLKDGPVWSFDLASTGCRPAWGGPDASAATNELAFAANTTLGMTLETSATPVGNNKWKYQSCIFAIDVRSGEQIAHVSVDGHQPVIIGTADGNFQVSMDGFSTVYTPELKVVGLPQKNQESAEKWTAAHWHDFRSGSDGKLWFDGVGGPKVLAQYPPNAAFIHPLGPTRVLVTAGREFSVFRSDGTRAFTERFTREGVHFAAHSGDYRRFAVAVYLWGVGDPSYLEEEKIIVYDSETGQAIAALPSDPLPQTQSWAALSPDGALLAVGAQDTLRLFRLPPPEVEHH